MGKEHSQTTSTKTVNISTLSSKTLPSAQSTTVLLRLNMYFSHEVRKLKPFFFFLQLTHHGIQHSTQKTIYVLNKIIYFELQTTEKCESYTSLLLNFINATLEKMSNLFTKFLSATKVLVIPEFSFAHLNRHVTSF